MRRLTNQTLVILGIFACGNLYAEESVKHLDLPDITSAEEASQVFLETTSQLNNKELIDATAMHDIHIITYSLEKAVAYYAEHLSGDRQLQAKEIADQVELLHIASENQRANETQSHLEQYLEMAELFDQGDSP